MFRKPLSCTRSPFSVSFSSRSPDFFGALISLNAVAGIALSTMLRIRWYYDIIQTIENLRDRVRLACAVIVYRKALLVALNRSAHSSVSLYALLVR